MIQVTVINAKTGLMGWGGQFSDQPSANAWIADCEAGMMWGKPARIITPDAQGILHDIDGKILDPKDAASINVITLVPAYPGVKASYKGFPKGAVSSIILQVSDVGVKHNANLFCDGVSTLNALLNAWNEFHPENPISLYSGDGSQIFAPITIAVAGGQDYIPAITTKTYNFAAEYSVTSLEVQE